MSDRTGADSAEREAHRYRRAAEETLHQLDWCVNYLRRIGRTRIARAIENNQRAIRTRMRGPQN
jgi:hypothetical protein